MSKQNDVSRMAEQMQTLTQNIQATSQGVAIVAEQMVKERQRTNDLMSATFEALSKRERPVFVKTLRDQGYSQQEVGDAISRSQSAVCQYEKKYDMQNSKS